MPMSRGARCFDIPAAVGARIVLAALGCALGAVLLANVEWDGEGEFSCVGDYAIGTHAVPVERALLNNVSCATDCKSLGR